MLSSREAVYKKKTLTVQKKNSFLDHPFYTEPISNSIAMGAKKRLFLTEKWEVQQKCWENLTFMQKNN